MINKKNKKKVNSKSKLGAERQSAPNKKGKKRKVLHLMMKLLLEYQENKI